MASATDSRLAGRHLIYRSRTTVYATQLSEDGLASTGPPTTLVERVRVALSPDVNPPTGQFDVSAGGALVYVTGSVLGSEPRRLASVDQNGSAEYLDIEPGNYSAPRVSPDGRLVAYVVGAGTQRSIWIGSLENSFQPRRLTPDDVSPREPVWSPDGRWIYFGGPPLSNGIWRQPADGSGPAAKLLELPVVAAPEAISPDGSTLMFSRGTPPNGEWRLASYNVTSREVEVNDGSMSTNWLEPSITGDGRWLAYVASEGGSQKIFVEPLPRTGARFELPHPLSTRGPVWSSRSLCRRGEPPVPQPTRAGFT